jgi:hypothetical protein
MPSLVRPYFSLFLLLGMPLKNLFRIALTYGSLSIIDFGPKGYRVRAVNLSPSFLGH